MPYNPDSVLISIESEGIFYQLGSWPRMTGKGMEWNAALINLKSYDYTKVFSRAPNAQKLIATAKVACS